jgi:hypothetical protein
MARKPKFRARTGQPTQTTEKGLEIPIPKRRAFLGNLKKATKAAPPKKT